jgi:peptide/nickel transport system substrate-binding protein
VSEALIDRRVMLQAAAYAGGGLLFLGGCTSDGESKSTSKPVALPEIEGAEIISDPARTPAAFKESPEFAQLVAAGKLPKVADRIGQDPLVIKPLHEIGKYGGQIRRGYTSVTDFNFANRFCAGPDSLLYWDHTHENVVPNIARAFELSADRTELTLQLRRGMNWSDGHPFTVDDIVFWRNDIDLNRAFGGGRGTAKLRVRGRPVVVEKVDDYTVVYRSPVPFAVLPELMAGSSDLSGQTSAGETGGGGFAPKHYLSKFHPTYTSETAANAAARDAGFQDWSAHLMNLNSWAANPDLPTVTPWITKRPINNSPWELTANPYSIWVDSEGNQLPYIPKISMGLVKNPEVISLRVVSGQFDFQDRGLEVDKLPVLVQSQERGDYKLYRSPGDTMDCAIRINLAYDKDNEIGDLLRTVEFRRALSLGIDREQVNQTFFLGSGVPSAIMPLATSPYHPGDDWRQKWATYEVQQANQLLDQIGLTKKDGQGFRLRPSGRGRIRLNIQSSAGRVNYPGVGEMIRRNWAQIGVDTTNQSVAPALTVERTLAGDVMLAISNVFTDDPFSNPDSFLPTVTNSSAGLIGIPFAKWFASGGKDGIEPPEAVRALKDAMALYMRGLEVDKAARAPLGQQLFKLYADQVWSIGVVGFGLALPGGLYIAKNNLGNVPARVFNSNQLKSPINAMPMTFYYK